MREAVNYGVDERPDVIKAAAKAANGEGGTRPTLSARPPTA